MSHPVSMIRHATTTWSLGRTAPCITQYSDSPPSIFKDFIQQLPPWESTLLEHLTMHSDIYTLHHCLQIGQACIGVSNGSVLSGKGAFRWCISQKNGHQLATGMGPTQGLTPSSYQAEGDGMLVILHILWINSLVFYFIL